MQNPGFESLQNGAEIEVCSGCTQRLRKLGTNALRALTEDGQWREQDRFLTVAAKKPPSRRDKTKPSHARRQHQTGLHDECGRLRSGTKANLSCIGWKPNRSHAFIEDTALRRPDHQA